MGLFSSNLVIGFFIKFPIYSFHICLPKVYGEAPVYRTILLGDVLLELGRHGLLRLIWVVTEKCIEYRCWVVGVELIGPIFS